MIVDIGFDLGELEAGEGAPKGCVGLPGGVSVRGFQKVMRRDSDTTADFLTLVLRSHELAEHIDQNVTVEDVGATLFSRWRDLHLHIALLVLESCKVFLHRE